ncbi:MAG: hypothetical protein ACREC4_06565, partial [Methylocella sp.]
DGAPCSGTGSFTQGASGLPSAAAAETLIPRRDELQIQGAHTGGVSKDAPRGFPEAPSPFETALRASSG